MDRRTRGGAAAATMRPMTAEQLEEFYADEYPKLIKILGVIFEAKIDEAEEAAQKAMEDFIRRSKAGQGSRPQPGRLRAEGGDPLLQSNDSQTPARTGPDP